MKIFVTGATGFIGSHFLRHALASGHEVVATHRGERRARVELPIEPRWLRREMEGLTPADLADCEALVHFASVGVSPQKASWDDMLDGNVVQLVRLLDVARTAGVRRLVLAGSFAEYGRSADDYERIPAGAPLLPTNGYATSKAAGSVAAHGYAVEHALELCYLRIFSAFGDGQFSGNFFPALQSAARAGQDFPMSAGEQVRDYIPVESVADAFLEAVLRDDVRAGVPVVENVASGEPVSMRGFAERWWSAWDAKGRLLIGAVPYRPGEPMRFAAELPQRHRHFRAGQPA